MPNLFGFTGKINTTEDSAIDFAFTRSLMNRQVSILIVVVLGLLIVHKSILRNFK